MEELTVNASINLGYDPGREQFLYALNAVGIQLNFTYLGMAEPPNITEAKKLNGKLKQLSSNEATKIDIIIGDANPLVGVIVRDLGIIYYIFSLKETEGEVSRSLEFLENNSTMIYYYFGNFTMSDPNNHFFAY